MAAAENANHCIAFASGSAATSAVIHLLSSHGGGDEDEDNHKNNNNVHILCVDDVYGGTQRYFRKIVYPTMGIGVDFIDFNNISLLETKLKDETNTIKLLWLETP